MTELIKMLLPLDLQFFAEGGEAGDTGGTDSGNGDEWVDSYYTGQDDNKGKQEENMIPKSRFDKVNTKYKELSELSKTKQAEFDALSAELAEADNSYKQLEENFTTTSKRVEALEGVLQTIINAELETIDESYHDLIPKDKPIEEQLAWLTKAKQKGLFTTNGFEFEIGQLSNPKQSNKIQKGFENMNPIQLLTMGYSK